MNYVDTVLDDYSWSNVLFAQVKDIIIVYGDINPNILFWVMYKDIASIVFHIVITYYLSYSDFHCCCGIHCNACIHCGYRLLDKVKTN